MYSVPGISDPRQGGVNIFMAEAAPGKPRLLLDAVVFLINIVVSAPCVSALDACRLI
jgi:hypothetical protein